MDGPVERVVGRMMEGRMIFLFIILPLIILPP